MKTVSVKRSDGSLKVQTIPSPHGGDGLVSLRVFASLLSAGTERMFLDFAGKSLLQKARSRPDLVKKVLQKIKSDGFATASSIVREKLDESIPLGNSCAGVVISSSDGAIAPGSLAAASGVRYANHAEQISVPAALVTPVPVGVTPAEACYVTLASIALHGVRSATPAIGEVGAVIGCGLIGQIAVQLLAAQGCRVVAVDPVKEKVEIARKLGADLGAVLGVDDVRTMALSATQGFGVDFVLVCAATSTSEPIVLAADLCRDRGRIVSIGATGLDLPRLPFYEKELSFVISRSTGPGRYDPVYEEGGVDYPIGYVRWSEGRNFDTVLDLMARGKLDVKMLTTHVFQVDRAEEAYELIRSGREPFLGVVLEYPEREVERTVQLATRAAVGGPRSLSVLGAGSFARSVLLPAFREAAADFINIASASGLSAAEVGKKFGFQQAVQESDVLADGSNAVAVLTRHDTHARFAADLLGRNRNVFVEKPLALDPDQLESIREALASSRGILMVGFNRRFAPATAEIRSAFSTIGEPLVMSVRVNAGTVPRDHWIQDRRIGGGRIIGEACHFVDWMTFVCGALPVEVHALAVAARRHDFPSRDQSVVTIRFENGSVGSLVYVARGGARLPKERYEVFAGGVAAVIDDFRSLTIYRMGRTKVAWRGRQDKGHRAEVRAFLDAVSEGGNPPIPYSELFAVTSATFAAEESFRTGAPCSV